MIKPEFLEMLRCPLDPKETKLEETDRGLACQKCRLVFPIKEGIPSLLVEEAHLPEGCPSVEALPCQQEEKK